MSDSRRPKRGRRPDRPPTRQPRPAEHESAGDGRCPRCKKGSAHPGLGGCDCPPPPSPPALAPVPKPSEREVDSAYAALDIIREARERYPEGLFPEPPAGEHGGTVDACSARAYRACLKSVYNEICKRLHLHPELREGAGA